MNYQTLEDEYDATVDEMLNVTVNHGDEVLYVDDKNNVYAGKVVGIDCYSNAVTPPTYFYEIENKDQTVGVEAEFVIKRRQQ